MTKNLPEMGNELKRFGAVDHVSMITDALAVFVNYIVRTPAPFFQAFWSLAAKLGIVSEKPPRRLAVPQRAETHCLAEFAMYEAPSTGRTGRFVAKDNATPAHTLSPV